MEKNENQLILIQKRFTIDGGLPVKAKKKRNFNHTIFRKKTGFFNHNFKRNPTNLKSNCHYHNLRRSPPIFFRPKKFTFFVFKPKKKRSNTGVNNVRSRENLLKLSYIKCVDTKKIEEDIKDEEKLYDAEKEDDIPILSKKFKDVIDCSILKFGAKESSNKIEYTFCKTCDSNLVFPICMACIKKCHKEHKIVEKTKLGNIKCACGANLHRINFNQNNFNDNYQCFGYEWNKTSKLNICYKSSKNKNICEFCKYICYDKNIKRSILYNFELKSDDDSENYKQNCIYCDCSNTEIHKDKLKNLQYIVIFFTKYNNIYKKLLHPLQIINMIFKTNKIFEKIFYDIFELHNFLNESIKKTKRIFGRYNTIDITKTKLYGTLIFFRKLVNNLSHKKLYYYCSEIIEYFNFDNLKKLYLCRPKNEKSFLIFMKEYLYLFNKVYIYYKTKFCDKYKINDLENFSCIQRIILLKNNKNEFTETEEIVSFFLEWLSNFENITYSYVEYLNCIFQIVLIIYRLSSYNLISINSLMKLLIKFEKIFDVINYIRNCIISKDDKNPKTKLKKSKIKFYTIHYSNTANANVLDIQRILNTNDESRQILTDIEIKIFYNVIKLLAYTLFKYNDKVIRNILFDNQKDEEKVFEKKNFLFLFNKSELGSIIFKHTITILSSVQNNYKNKNRKQSKIYKIILRNSMKILEHSLCNNDIYFSNIIRSINNIEKYYSFFIKNNESYFKSKIYNELLQEKKKISLSYENFFIFKISKEELITNIDKSISNVLGENNLHLLSNLYNEDFTPICFKLDENSAILETKYYFEISKIIEILTYSYNNKNIKKKAKTIYLFESKKRDQDKYNSASSNHEIDLFSLIISENYKNIFDKLILFYFCFSFESSDNSLLVLSHYILNELMKLPLDYGYLLFKLFYLCILNIASIDFMLVNGKDIIKNLYKFLQKLILTNEQNASVCILFFLKILEIISFKIKNFHSDFVYTIQKYIFLLHNDYQLSFKYFELVIKEKIEKLGTYKVSSRDEISDSKPKKFSMVLNKNLKMNINIPIDQITKSHYNENNIIKNSFNIYIKLLNEAFDFSIHQDRKKVKYIIDISKVSYLLKYCNLSIGIRTEFLKFSRKLLIDLIYSESSNDLYTKIIINDEDNLISLKYNPLTNNSKYPTKYLSFMQDFYNISAKESLCEKYDFYQSLQLMKQFPSEEIQNKFLKISFVSKNTSRLSYDGSRTPTNSNIFNNSILFNNQLKDNNNDIKNFDKNNKINNNSDNKKGKIYSKRCSCPQNINNFLSFSLYSHKSKISSNKENLFPILEDESSKKIENIKNKIHNNINQLNESNNDSSSYSEFSNIEINKNLKNKNEEIQKSNIYKINIIKSPNASKILKSTLHLPVQSINENSLGSKNEIDFLPCFDELSYEILKNELENLTNHVRNDLIIEDDEIVKEDLKNYFENGLLIPIIYFFKKSFSLVHNFSGEEMIKLYSLIEQSINLKLYISKMNSNLWEDEENGNENPKETTDKDKKEFKLKYILNNNIKKNQNMSMIKGKYFKNKKLIESTYKSLDLIKSKKISIFDYKFLYHIVENEFFYLLKSKEIKYSDETFENEKRISFELQEKVKELIRENKNHKNIEKDINIKFIYIYLEYIYNKTILSNEKNSSLISILNEINIINETNYRNILLNILIYNCAYENLISEYRNKSYYLLYKLISLKTAEIQIDIVNMLSDDIEENKNDFIFVFSNDLLQQIIQLLIEYLNPLNEIYISHYLPTYLLIKIFKLFCQDHSCFFKIKLTRLLSYKYINIKNFYYKSLKFEEINKSGIFENKQENSELKTINDGSIDYENIKFFDFFLYLVVKIILISNWDQFENDEIQNPFLHKLFYSILEMLNEIIQGNKKIISFMIEERKIENKIILKDDESSKSNKINNIIKTNKNGKNAVSTFLKHICQVLIIDKSNIDLLNEIKINIIEFILSLIEIKNNNKNIQKELLKYLKINKVLSIIIHIFKNIYSNKKNKLKINETLTLNQEEITKNDSNNTNNFKNNQYIGEISYKSLKKYKKIFREFIFDNKNISLKSESTSYPLMNKNNAIDLLNSESKKNEMNNSNIIHPSSTCKLQNYTNETKNPVNENIILKTYLYHHKQLLKNISIANRPSIEKNTNKNSNKMGEAKLVTIKKDFTWDFNSQNEEILQNEKLKILYDNKLYEFFIHEFVNVKSFRKTKEFILANALYKYLKIVAIVNDNLEIKRLMSKVHSTKIKLNKDNNDAIDDFLKSSNEKIKKNNYQSKKNRRENLGTKKLKEYKLKNQLEINEEKENKNYDKEFIEKFYIIKFFERITNILEVRTSDNTNQIVIYTKIPEMMYLSEYTKNEFEYHVNRECEITKKNDLIESIKYFIAEIKYFEKSKKYISKFNNINFKIFPTICYIYALMINFILLLIIKGDDSLSVDISTKIRRNNKTYIRNSIKISFVKYRNLLNILNNIHLVLNGIIICFWTSFRFPFLYKLEKIKYTEKNQCKKKINFIDKIYIIFIKILLKRDNIITIIFHFIIAIINKLIKDVEILYSLYLIPIFILNPTLNYITVSIQIRYKQLLILSFFLFFIVIYTLTNFCFFFFNSDYEDELDYFDDNYCKSLIFCFLNSLDNGLRARGGIGDSGKRISFLRNSKHYIGRLILDTIFFLLIVIFLTNMVFGIIIESFSFLQQKEHKYLKDRYNFCFICNGNRSLLERHKINFREHLKYKHNLWDYVEYIISIKQSTFQELNTINLYIKKKIENNDISWLPIYTDLIKKSEDNESDEIVILNESSFKYKIKNKKNFGSTVK